MNDILKKLNKYYLKSRYPDLIYEPLSNPDKNFTKIYLEKTKKLFLWLQKQ
ncbi:HEPN domain-containing protein [Candidatus Parcubacteria bacterium]|nr:HEPN domain-containing protein [Candidatus Parcubacteria bacterium]